MRQALGPGALGRPRGIGWRGKLEGGSGWGTHVNPWLFHSNVWQNSLQIKKIKKKIQTEVQKKKKRKPCGKQCQNKPVGAIGTVLWVHKQLNPRLLNKTVSSNELPSRPVTGPHLHRPAGAGCPSALQTSCGQGDCPPQAAYLFIISSNFHDALGECLAY